MTDLNISKVRSILSQNDVQFAGIFGSRARGDNRPDSDIDLIVRFKEGKIKGLFELIALQRELSEILGIKVDLVTEGSISPHIKKYALKDLRVIYQ